jgi:hypothetical protein
VLQIYEDIIETYENKFVLPDNIIRRGFDYYVSVAVSDTNDNFANFASTRFRVMGNLWALQVDNSRGWTVEFSLKVADTKSYGRVSIGDGAKFVETRFYADKIEMYLSQKDVLSF